MIPLVPIAFAVLALLAWRYDARARRAYEATLSEAEKRQFRALRRVHPRNGAPQSPSSKPRQPPRPRRTPRRAGRKREARNQSAKRTEIPAQDALVSARRLGIERD